MELRGKTILHLALKKIASFNAEQAPSCTATARCPPPTCTTTTTTTSGKVKCWLKSLDCQANEDSGNEASDPNDSDFVPKSYCSSDNDTDSSYEDLPPFFDPPESFEEEESNQNTKMLVSAQDESSMPSSIVYPIITGERPHSGLETCLPLDQERVRSFSDISYEKTQVKFKKPKRPCFFCGQAQTQLLRHLKMVHKDESTVKQAMALPKAKRSKAFNALKKKGIMIINIKLKSEGKQLLRERRPGSENNQQLAICNGCKGFYSKRRIAKHQKQCEECKGGQKKSLSVKYIGEEINDDEFTCQILNKFRSDETGKLCQSDFVVIRLGRKLWAKSARKERRVIMNDMRTLGNLIIEFRKAAHIDDLQGIDLINRENFDHLTKAIQNMTHTETGALKPGLKLAIGYLLKKVIKVMKGCYIQEGKLEAGEEVDRFSALLDLEWEFIFYGAQLMCEQRRQNLRKPGDMPLEKDLTKFRSYIIEMTSKLASDNFQKWDRHEFIEMRNLLVSRLTLFNARRGGEPARMLLSEWKDAENDAWIDNQRVDSVTDPLEKELISDMKLAYQTGKGSRRLVPVLFPKDTLAPIQKLIEEREECGVSDDNPYLFPNTGLSNDHAIGWNSIQNVARKMGNELDKPSLLTADKFRHRTSTLFASLEMPREKREAFFRHMGHSEGINRDVYQCPLALREITEVGSFLNALDKGDADTSQRNPNEEEEIIDTSHTDVETHVPEHPEEWTNKSSNKARIDIDADLPSQEPRQKIRRYRKWSQTDAAKVTSYFGTFIDDIDSPTTSRGSLPSKKSVEDFLLRNIVFHNEDISHNELISLIKTKVFNERKKKRESVLKVCE